MSYPAARGSPPRAGQPHLGHRVSSAPWPGGSGQPHQHLNAHFFPNTDMKAGGPSLTSSASMRSVSYNDPHYQYRGSEQAEPSTAAAAAAASSSSYHNRNWAPQQPCLQELQHAPGRLPLYNPAAAQNAYSRGGSERERLPSSQSMSSVSSAQPRSTRRAPAPAALDLSPRQQNTFAGQVTINEDEANYTERLADVQMVRTLCVLWVQLTLSQPVPRPLPSAPSSQPATSHSQPSSSPHPPKRTDTIPFPDHDSQPNGSTSVYYANSQPLAVPSSSNAMGLDDTRRTPVSDDQRLSVATNGDRLS